MFERCLEQVRDAPRKVDIRLPGKGNSNSHGARPVYRNHLDETAESRKVEQQGDIAALTAWLAAQAASTT